MTKRQPRTLDAEEFARDMIAIRHIALQGEATAGELMRTTRCPNVPTLSNSIPDPTSVVTSLWMANVHANKLSLQLTQISEQLYTLADELCQARTTKTTPPKDTK